MNQLLLSSQRLNAHKVLQTGSLNVFETLVQHGDLEGLTFSAALPEKPLVLEWKEVKTPETPQSFRDLVGKKLVEYKFQYLGQFKYDGEVINPATETFASSFPNKSIHNNELESTGWVNCTWLIDFLMNAKSIQDNPLRSEMLIWRAEKENFVLALSTEAFDNQSAEQEKFVFGDNFTTIAWEHKTLFSR